MWWITHKLHWWLAGFFWTVCSTLKCITQNWNGFFLLFIDNTNNTSGIQNPVFLFHNTFINQINKFILGSLYAKINGTMAFNINHLFHWSILNDWFLSTSSFSDFMCGIFFSWHFAIKYDALMDDFDCTDGDHFWYYNSLLFYSRPFISYSIA